MLDTGATKTALFRAALRDAGIDTSAWPSLRGLQSPTLYGTPDMLLVRVPRLRVGEAVADSIDASLLDGDVANALDRAIGRRVHGLLGRSFLRRFDVALDGDRRLLWLAAREGPRDEREWEYSTVGLQVERRGGAIVAAGVRLLAIDGRPATALGAVECARLLEGAPGTAVRVRWRARGGAREVRLVRRVLL